MASPLSDHPPPLSKKTNKNKKHPSYVHTNNPVTNITPEQVQLLVDAKRSGTPTTWGSVFPEANWAANAALRDAPVTSFWSSMSGGQRPAVQTVTGVHMSDLVDSTDPDVAAYFGANDNGIAFRANANYGTTIPSYRYISYQGVKVGALDYAITAPFYLSYNIIDASAPRKALNAAFVCDGALAYPTDPTRDMLAPLKPADLAAARAHAGCA